MRNIYNYYYLLTLPLSLPTLPTFQNRSLCLATASPATPPKWWRLQAGTAATSLALLLLTSSLRLLPSGPEMNRPSSGRQPESRLPTTPCKQPPDEASRRSSRTLLPRQCEPAESWLQPPKTNRQFLHQSLKWRLLRQLGVCVQSPWPTTSLRPTSEPTSKRPPGSFSHQVAVAPTSLDKKMFFFSSLLQTRFGFLTNLRKREGKKKKRTKPLLYYSTRTPHFESHVFCALDRLHATFHPLSSPFPNPPKKTTSLNCPLARLA